MTKIKPRYTKLPTTLKTATNEEVFAEFMKRVVKIAGGRPSCFFVDSVTKERVQYEIHHAADELPSELFKSLIKSNEF